jgi:signal transduction histidine kinase/DNA-binding response OmpR family regulator
MVLRTVLEVAFYGVSAATLVSYLRHRRSLDRDVAAVFGSVALLLILQFLRGHLPGGPTSIADIGVALLLANPFLTLRVVAHFRRLPRGMTASALALLIAMVVLYIGTGSGHGPAAKLAIIPVVAYFFGAEALVIFYLTEEARRRVGVARVRLATAAMASGLFLGAILIAAIGSAIGRPTGVDVAVDGVALAAALGYLIAFVPPDPIRRLGQRAAAYGFVRQLASEPSAATAPDLWQRLADAARDVTGATAVVVLMPGPDGVLERQALAGSASEIALADLTPTLDVSATVRSSDTIAVLDRMPVNVVRIPVGTGHGPLGQVRCYVTGEPLFSEDDTDLIELFAALTLRMVEGARLTDELRQANDGLAQASAAKTDFLAAMSHELRTPLNAVIGFSELLQDPVEANNPDLTLEFAGHIREAGMHLLELVNDVLDLSKVEAGRLDLRREEVDLVLIARQTIDMMRPMADRKQVTINLQGLGSLPVWVDGGRMRQVAYNLLSNAVKFTPAAGRVVVRVESDARGIRLAVKDTGPGIAQEEQERIFDAFVQGQLGGAQEEGTGLGLALTRRLVELHGGSLELDSQLGVGSEFRVLLPATAVRRASGSAETSVNLDPGGISDGRRVLVIEDDPNVSRLLEIYLEEAGYQVEVAASGEDGLARAQTDCFDAILLDVLLPGLDGWHVLTSLKSEPKTREIPVLIVSVVDDLQMGLALGAVDYLVKPIHRAALIGAMGRLEQGRAVARADSLVLGIDDDPVALRLYQATLEGMGIVVATASGGVEGVRLARELKPGCILLDLLMPDLDGFEVLAQLKADPETSQIPVIVITAVQISEEEKQRLNGQVVAVLEKGDAALVGLGEWLSQAMLPSPSRQHV